VPVWEQLESYCKLKGLEVQSLKDLCQHPRILDLLNRQIDALTPNLARYEKIKAIALLENEFSIEGGELTPTLKIKRRVIDEKYRDIIDRLYEEAETSRHAE
jgi:long-chain acyl-CoA synthetase